MVRVMNATEHKWWQNIRAKGERRYVLRRALWWGLWFGVGHFIFGIIFKYYLRDAWNYFLYDRALMAIYYFLGGCLIGIWEWRRNEKKYHQPTVSDEA